MLPHFKGMGQGSASHLEALIISEQLQVRGSYVPTVLPTVYEAKNQAWIEVEVRRPLEADFSSERGPSRAVRLVWGLVSGPF